MSEIVGNTIGLIILIIISSITLAIGSVVLVKIEKKNYQRKLLKIIWRLEEMKSDDLRRVNDEQVPEMHGICRAIEIEKIHDRKKVMEQIRKTYENLKQDDIRDFDLIKTSNGQMYWFVTIYSKRLLTGESKESKMKTIREWYNIRILLIKMTLKRSMCNS